MQVMFSGHLGTQTLAITSRRVYASVTRDEKQRKLFVKFVNATSDLRALAITIERVSKASSQAKLVTLSGKTPNATNSISHPDAIVPVEHNISIAGLKFTQNFAPYSINVLELRY